VSLEVFLALLIHGFVPVMPQMSVFPGLWSRRGGRKGGRLLGKSSDGKHENEKEEASKAHATLDNLIIDLP